MEKLGFWVILCSLLLSPVAGIASPCSDSLSQHKQAMSEMDFRFWRMEFYQTHFGQQCLAEFRQSLVDSTKVVEQDSIPAAKQSKNSKSKPPKMKSKEGKK